jgi:hypothetical protein
VEVVLQVLQDLKVLKVLQALLVQLVQGELLVQLAILRNMQK